jgi:hypothetical protein
MKTTYRNVILLLLFCVGFSSNAQNDMSSKIERNIPLIVAERFNTSYPDKNPVWFSRYKGRYDQKLVYEAKFIFDKRYCKAVYDINGNQLAFAATIEYLELPEDARTYMKEKYATFPIAESLLVTDSEKTTTYEVGIYIDNQFVIQIFSSNGTFLNNTAGY